MSVDLSVYAASPLSSDEVAAVVAAVPGLALDGAPEAMAGVQSTGQWGMTVARGKRARSSFTVAVHSQLIPMISPTRSRL